MSVKVLSLFFKRQTQSPMTVEEANTVLETVFPDHVTRAYHEMGNAMCQLVSESRATDMFSQEKICELIAPVSFVGTAEAIQKLSEEEYAELLSAYTTINYCRHIRQ